MKPKPFTLHRLLDIRRGRQKRQEQAVSAAAHKVRQQEAEVARAIGRQVAARGELHDLLTTGPGGAGRVPGAPPPGMAGRAVPVTEVKRYRAYLSALARQAGQAAALLPALRQSEAVQRGELAEARRAVKVLENLRDRRRVALRRWQRRREQRNLDEVAARRARRPAPRPPREPTSGPLRPGSAPDRTTPEGPSGGGEP